MSYAIIAKTVGTGFALVPAEPESGLLWPQDRTATCGDVKKQQVIEMKMSKLEKKFVNSQRHAERNLKLLEQVFSRIDLNHVTKVLEIGCGVGIVGAHLANEYNMNVTGTDLDPVQIEMAKKRNPENQNLKFIEADATKLPFGNLEFEMVLSLNVMHHIGDWYSALGEVNRVLKPEGYFIFADLAYSRFFTRILSPIAKNYGIYTIDEIINFLKGNRFEVLYIEGAKALIMKSYRIGFQKRR